MAVKPARQVGHPRVGHLLAGFRVYAEIMETGDCFGLTFVPMAAPCSGFGLNNGLLGVELCMILYLSMHSVGGIACVLAEQFKYCYRCQSMQLAILFLKVESDNMMHGLLVLCRDFSPICYEVSCVRAGALPDLSVME